MVRKDRVRPEDLERFRPFLYRQARRQLGSRLRRKLDAADIVQETLLKAHEKLKQFRGQTEAELAAWLRTILENTLAMAVRQFQAARGTLPANGLCEAASVEPLHPGRLVRRPPPVRPMTWLCIRSNCSA